MGNSWTPRGRVLRHLVMPALPLSLFLAVASTPVEVLGCRNRGLLAGGIALAAEIASLGAAIAALRGRLRGDPGSFWWIASSVILAAPAAVVLLLDYSSGNP